jgi:hypothetical protein
MNSQNTKIKGVGLIDTIRISHAKGELVDELMRTGTIALSDDEKTWETLKAQGHTWAEILDMISIPHMALLRNLRGIFLEVRDESIRDKVLHKLVSGVKHGKQFRLLIRLQQRRLRQPRFLIKTRV